MSDNSHPAQVQGNDPSICLIVAQFNAEASCFLCSGLLVLQEGCTVGAYLPERSNLPVFCCSSCVARHAPTLHALLKPPFPGKIVRQTIAHHTEFGDGRIRTMQYKIDRFDVKLKDGQCRIKAVGQLVDEEIG